MKGLKYVNMKGLKYVNMKGEIQGKVESNSSFFCIFIFYPRNM